MAMSEVTSLPMALRDCALIPLRNGTKIPAVRHATLENAARWDPTVDDMLAKGGRVGVMMAGELVVLDIDVDLVWAQMPDEPGSTGTAVTVDGHHDLERVMQMAGITQLPHTLRVLTQGGGVHLYFRQNPAYPVTQCKIGHLDVKAARNSYCAIGAGYEVEEDVELAVFPADMARVIMTTPGLRGAGKHDTLPGDRTPGSTYGNAQEGFNNALTAIKGYMVQLGWPETQANDAIRALNRASDDPMDEARLESTVLRDKGWQPGERVSDDVVVWAQKQVGLTDEQQDNRWLDVNTVKRLWTTDQYRKYQELELAEPPERESMQDVVLEPPPEFVIDGFMTVGLYGLAGPEESGKSLLVRDLAEAVANGTRWNGYNVLRARPTTVVISEGHHDLQERWARVRKNSIFIYRTPVLLTNELTVDRFIEQHDGTDTGLVIFDLIYHMGVQDDNKSADVGPVLKACRRISRELQCAVLAVGHPGHKTGRRFRGSSLWRNWFDGEFHMADALLTCEKHKYARREMMEWPYEIEWPRLRYLNPEQLVGRQARVYAIHEEMKKNPDMSIRQMAERLHEDVGGVSADRWRKLIAEQKRAIEREET